MPVSFLQKIKEMSITKFEWTSFDKKVSSLKEGEKERNVYLVLKLAEPMAEVVGSLYEYDPNSDARVARRAYDVTEVYCNVNVMSNYESEFTFDMDDKEEL